ncbi:Uncharacterised protein [Bordetella pertussis]|nr:Uncharacterised protein [Bordetella pertussis]
MNSANTPISSAIRPSVVRRPMRSASQPEARVHTMASAAPAICTTSTSPLIWLAPAAIHDSGNTVTRWNSA